MNNQEAKFDVVETLALIGQATAFWQSLDPKKLDDMCTPDMDNTGEPRTEQAA
jgi:hypothetical protein